jgi:hypothetical protein
MVTGTGRSTIFAVRASAGLPRMPPPGRVVSLGLIGQAVGLFAVTNIDDIVVLALFFGQAAGRSGTVRVVLGQYLGFAAILAVAVAGALGVGLLPE